MSEPADDVCRDCGILVGMEDRIGAGERDIYRVRGEIVGCSRVFCRLCQSWVKHIDGYRIWAAPLEREQYGRLYETLDPKLFHVLRADADFRTYVCRCNWADTPGIKRLAGGDIDGWGCAGHGPAGSETR